MAFLSTIPEIEALLHRKVVVERKSVEIISLELQEAYPHITCGLASRSVRRFCSERGIHATSRLTDVALDRVVATSVSKISYLTINIRHRQSVTYTNNLILLRPRAITAFVKTRTGPDEIYGRAQI